MNQKRILGLDVGDARIGVAISDPLELTAQPFEVIPRKKDKREINRIKELIDTYQVESIVIGLPRATDGNLSAQGKKIKDFAEELVRKLSVGIVFKDEYLTTQRAEEILIESGMRREKRRDMIDKISASLILQGYLDEKRFKEVK